MVIEDTIGPPKLQKNFGAIKMLILPIFEFFIKDSEYTQSDMKALKKSFRVPSLRACNYSVL